MGGSQPSGPRHLDRLGGAQRRGEAPCPSSSSSSCRRAMRWPSGSWSSHSERTRRTDEDSSTSEPVVELRQLLVDLALECEGGGCGGRVLKRVAALRIRCVRWMESNGRTAGRRLAQPGPPSPARRRPRPARHRAVVRRRARHRLQLPQRAARRRLGRRSAAAAARAASAASRSARRCSAAAAAAAASARALPRRSRAPPLRRPAHRRRPASSSAAAAAASRRAWAAAASAARRRATSARSSSSRPAAPPPPCAASQARVQPLLVAVRPRRLPGGPSVTLSAGEALEPALLGLQVGQRAAQAVEAVVAHAELFGIPSAESLSTGTAGIYSRLPGPDRAIVLPPCCSRVVAST